MFGPQFRDIKINETIGLNSDAVTDGEIIIPLPQGARVLFVGFQATIEGVALTGSYHDSSNASSPYDVWLVHFRVPESEMEEIGIIVTAVILMLPFEPWTP